MAKKTAKTAKTPKSTKATKSTKKPAAPKAKQKPARQAAEPVEIQLDGPTSAAYDLIQSSPRVCDEIELAVTAAICQQVRKIIKAEGIALNPEQAEQLAALLFGD
jgi:hypothetical protein